MPSEANLWPTLTGAEVLRFLGQLHGSVDTAYRDELVRRFELVLDKKIRAYSHGNRQKVLLIAVFASRADVLLLDEPTTGLDPLMEQVFRACVREAADRGQTVLLSSHILSEVEAVCDRVAMLRAAGPDHRDRPPRRCSVGWPQCGSAAELDGPSPELTAIAGVSNVVGDGHTVECDVSGPMEPLLPRPRRRGRPPPRPESRRWRSCSCPATATGRSRMGTVDDDRDGDGGRGRDTARRGRASGSRPRPDRRRAFRQVWKGAMVWALAFGATVAATGAQLRQQLPRPGQP